MNIDKIINDLKKEYNISDTCQALRNLENAMRAMAETIEKA